MKRKGDKIEGGEKRAKSDRNIGVIYGGTEAEVGILYYCSEIAPVSAILKHRYTDFLVNEVDEDDNVESLLDIDTIPTHPTLVTVSGPEDAGTYFGTCLSTEQVGEIERVAAGEVERVEVEGLGKEDRIHVHEGVTRFYPHLQSQTQDGVLRIGRGVGRKRQSFPATGPQYLSFLLHKQNHDLHNCISLLAKRLHRKSADFHYAGTKDKRGVTVQRVTVARVLAEDLHRTVQQLHSGAIMTGDYRYVDHATGLGDLKGNQFRMILRRMDMVPADMEAVAAGLRARGFLNYFGMQRFGYAGAGTHRLGWHYLSGDFDGMVSLLLAPVAHDKEEVRRAKDIFRQTGDAKQTLRVLPRYMRIEARLLQALQHNDSREALLRLDRNVLLLYPHSYQSYLWNWVASYRAQIHGTEHLIPGDLVFSNPKRIEAHLTPKEKALSKFEAIHIVTQADIDANKYTIDDMVLPTPGSKVIYPDYLKEVYMRLLKADGLEMDAFHQAKQPLYLPGDYRPFLCKPKQLYYQFIRHAEMEDQLQRTDRDVLEGKALNYEAGDLQALQLTFTLPASCYATMLLREITSLSTSKADMKASSTPM